MDCWTLKNKQDIKDNCKRWFDKYALWLEKLTDKVYNNQIYEEIKQRKRKRLLIDKKIGSITIVNYFKYIIKNLIIIISNNNKKIVHYGDDR